MIVTAFAEVAANTLTLASQTAPAIATFADGSFVVVWGTSDSTQDGSGYAIKSQRFDVNGSKVGAETLVNSSGQGNQALAQVAALPDGGYVVTWTTQGDPTYIDARIFDASGAAVGLEFQVSDITTSRQDNSQITVLDNGNFVISWNDWSGFNVLGRIYQPDGTPVGSQLRLNAIDSSFEEYGDIAALTGGGFVATWRSTDAARDGDSHAVIARVFDNDGVGGTEFVVNTATAGSQYSPSVVGLANGTFVVTWFTTDPAQDGSSGAIKGQIFDAAGARIGSEFLVNQHTAGNQRSPVVVAAPDGGFAVLWETDDVNQDGSGGAIKGARFNASGERTSPEFMVNLGATGGQTLADAAFQPDGKLVAVWASFANPFEADIRLRSFIFDAGSSAGTSGYDTIEGGALNDSLYGQAGDDALIGNDGNDILNGGAGADRMTGGLGNDRYIVDNALDRIYETAGQGTDRVSSSTSYVLAAGVSVEILDTSNNQSTAALNLTGNEIANELWGNFGNNILDGGAGADYMGGYLGDDIYYVDNAADVTRELSGEGTDTIRTSVSYVLANGRSIEVMETTSAAGTAAINLTGNDLANILIGNAGNNILNGGAGDDVLRGGAGNDTYVVNSSGDVVEEIGGGDDRVSTSISYALSASASIETLNASNQNAQVAINLTGNDFGQTIAGNAGANVLTGAGGSDYLIGYDGNDRLVGGSGLDRLSGGAGNDRFVFEALSDSTSVARDRILDFIVGDLIDLSGIDADASALGDQQFDFIGGGAFTYVAGQLRAYASGSGSWIVDADCDGNGVADFSLLVTASAGLSGGDFLL